MNFICITRCVNIDGFHTLLSRTFLALSNKKVPYKNYLSSKNLVNKNYSGFLNDKNLLLASNCNQFDICENKFKNFIFISTLISTMSSDIKNFDGIQTDGSVDESVRDKSSTSIVVETVNASVDTKMEISISKRNVQTQHGDYRSVDEENIVVLRQCVSPDPYAATDEGEQSGDNPVREVVWFEPFECYLDENEQVGNLVKYIYRVNKSEFYI